jgi:Leucine-rich repeat (LRR) protein
VTFALGVRLLGRALPLDCEKMEQAVCSARAKLGIDREVEVCSSQGVRSPVIWCWRRKPVLLVPDAAGRSDNGVGWTGVLCHELAHWKRLDHISGLLAELAGCILPWHLLLWWAKSRMISLSEQACDDWVLATGQPGTDYAESLLNLIPEGQMAFVPAVVSSKRGLADRVRRILQANCVNPRAGVVWALAVSIVAVCIAAGVAFAQTRPAKTEGQNAEELKTSEVRITHFPKDRSLGTLYIRDFGSESWYEDWERFGEAKSDISIPPKKQVKLQVNEESAGDLSHLTKLRADDLQMLSFGWKEVEISSLAPIGNLKGLKALNLQRAKFNSRDFKHLTGLAQLEVLRFGDYQLTDESMKYIGQLTSLRSLALWGTGISDEGLKHLQGLTNLTFLALNRCKITDDGLDYLKNMKALEGLQIYQTEITDRGLEKLRGLGRLKHIKINDNGITDKGLKHLENLTSLENIWLDSNPITDKGLSYLAGMKNLKELYAGRTEITDAGLVNLKGMKDFHHLLISGIGDEGIRHLSELQALEMLQIQDAQVTKASIPDFKKMMSAKQVLLSGDKINDDLLDALRTALPNCKIWDPQRSRDYPMPEWRKRFEAVYRLEDGQILKRVSSPFIPERRDYYLNEHSSQAKLVPRSPDRFTFHWPGKLKNWGLAFARTDIKSTLRGVLRLKSYEFEGPRELLDLNLPGDWIVRDEAPVAAKLAVLQEVLANELERKIRFEKRTVEHEVIVATGRFSFHPLAEARKQDAVHLYVDELSSSGGGTVDSVAELLQTIGNRANTYVVDRTEPSEGNNILYYLHRSSRPLRQMESSPEKTEKLKVLLGNITKQTELQFELGSQPVEVWFVTEENEEKR